MTRKTVKGLEGEITQLRNKLEVYKSKFDALNKRYETLERKFYVNMGV